MDELLETLRSGAINFDDKAKEAITKYVISELEYIKQEPSNYMTSGFEVGYEDAVPVSEIDARIKELKAR